MKWSWLFFSNQKQHFHLMLASWVAACCWQISVCQNRMQQWCVCTNVLHTVVNSGIFHTYLNVTTVVDFTLERRTKRKTDVKKDWIQFWNGEFLETRERESPSSLLNIPIKWVCLNNSETVTLMLLRLPLHSIHIRYIRSSIIYVYTYGCAYTYWTRIFWILPEFKIKRRHAQRTVHQPNRQVEGNSRVVRIHYLILT